MSKTRLVLNYFEQTQSAVSMTELARNLQLTSGVLQGILDYWVRKGKLREVTVDTQVCKTCDIQSACPFVMTMPRYYEHVGVNVSSAECNCDGRCGV